MKNDSRLISILIQFLWNMLIENEHKTELPSAKFVYENLYCNMIILEIRRKLEFRNSSDFYRANFTQLVNRKPSNPKKRANENKSITRK
jgi:hypothetical protein